MKTFIEVVVIILVGVVVVVVVVANAVLLLQDGLICHRNDLTCCTLHMFSIKSTLTYCMEK